MADGITLVTKKTFYYFLCRQTFGQECDYSVSDLIMTLKNSASTDTLYLFSVIHSVLPLVSRNDINRLVFVMVTHGFFCCASAH